MLIHPGVGWRQKLLVNKEKFPQSSDFVCTTCAIGKLILKPSYLKIKHEAVKFLEQIQGDICGPI